MTVQAKRALRAVVAAGLICTLAGPAAGAAPALPAGVKDNPPVLRLEGGGPTAPVTAMAFGPDGRTFYAAGFDKVVRTWDIDDRGQFTLRRQAVYRVPIGPGSAGVINCIAVSPDNRWLAVGGVGLPYHPKAARYADEGASFAIRVREMDEGTGAISLFPIERTDKEPSEPRHLLGHTGPVVALAFAPARDGTGAVLVSAAREPSGPEDERLSSGRVCAWDVDGTRLAASWTLPRVATDKFPALAVRRTGDGLTGLRVAIAWGDGQLHLWDLKDKEPRDFPDGALTGNTTAVFTAATDLVTGGYQPGKKGGDGYLRYRGDAPGRGTPSGTVEVFHNEGYEFQLPVGLGLVAPARAGDPGHLATLLAIKRNGEANLIYNLALVSLTDRKRVASALLWEQATADPVLACSPDGRWVAVAGAGQPSIRVFAVADLLEGKKKDTSKTLESVGLPVRHVAFAARAGKGAPVPKGTPPVGLLLTAERVPVPGRPNERDSADLVFDFAGRTLTRLTQGRDPDGKVWAAAGAGASGWSVTFREERKEGRCRFDWKGPEGQDGSAALPLEAAEQVTAAAVLPPSRDVIGEPLLAAATWNSARGLIQLALYRARSGVKVRELRGHTQPIHSLDASPDGRYLVSAAGDDTVCVWSALGLGQVLGRHGTLAGIVLAEHGKELVVAAGRKESVKKDGQPEEEPTLYAGDAITSLAAPADQAPLTSLAAYDFWDKVWDLKPGQKVRLTVQRNGAAQNLTLTVDQGVDVAKPLLSLFLARFRGTNPDWIAWSPYGYFDSDGDRIEEQVGWHFNPKQPGGAADFGDLATHRADFFKKGFLRPLLASGDLQKALDEVNRPPHPNVRIISPRPEGPDSQVILVPDPAVKLEAELNGPSIARGQVGSAELTLDGRAEATLNDFSGQWLTRELRLEKRHEYTLRLTVVTVDRQAESQERRLLYLPPPPKVGLIGLPEGKDETDEDRYTVRARVSPGRPGEKFAVHLFQVGANRQEAEVPLRGGVDVKPEAPGSDILRVEKAVRLERGPNQFRLLAVNAGARPEDGGKEAAAQPLLVVNAKQDTPRPVFTEVELTSGSKGARTLAIDPGNPRVIVDMPTVRLHARVAAKDELKEVELVSGKTRLATFPGPGKKVGPLFTLTLDHRLEGLRPGQPRPVVLRARTEHSDWGETPALFLDYLPPLPVLTLTGPERNTLLTESKDRPREAGPPVEVKGAFDPVDDPQPFDVVIQVTNGGKAVPQGRDDTGEVVLHFDRPPGPAGESVTLHQVRVRRGLNDIKVRVRNQWRKGEAPWLERAVTFNRPPFLHEARAEAVREKGGGKVVLTLTADAPAEVPLRRLVIAGEPFPVEALRPEVKSAQGMAAWTFKKEIPYPQGKQKLALRVENDDGADVGEVDLPPAVQDEDLRIKFLDVPVPVDRSSCGVTVRVRSLARPDEVVVKLKKGDKGFEQVKRLSGAGATKPGPGQPFWELRQAVRVEGLSPGENIVKAEARDVQGREREESVSVTYVQPGIRIELVRPQRPNGKLPADYELRAKLVWTDPAQGALVDRSLGQLRVTVNGFRQRPLLQPLPERPPDALGQEFRVRLLLNGQTNEVRFLSEDLPLEETKFTFACDHPRRPGRLHLLIVNAGKNRIRDEDLVEHAFKALGIPRPAKGERLQSEVFADVVSYSASTDPSTLLPLKGEYASQAMVQDFLDRINRALREGQDGSTPSDAVLVYWLGEVRAGKDGEWYLPTSDTYRPANKRRDLSETAIPLRELVTTGADEVVGARVVLLDTTADEHQEARLAEAFGRGRTDAAVLLYPWSQAEVPRPGLLEALESAGKEKKVITLADVAERARKFQDPRLLEPVFHLAGLGELLMAETKAP